MSKFWIDPSAPSLLVPAYTPEHPSTQPQRISTPQQTSWIQREASPSPFSLEGGRGRSRPASQRPASPKASAKGPRKTPTARSNNGSTTRFCAVWCRGVMCMRCRAWCVLWGVVWCVRRGVCVFCACCVWCVRWVCLSLCAVCVCVSAGVRCRLCAVLRMCVSYHEGAPCVL